MELNDIKEKLEEGLTNKDWEKVVEVIGDIEVEENYLPPFGDDYHEEDWNDI